jgi:uncharacterized protein (TIGR02145 family)
MKKVKKILSLFIVVMLISSCEKKEWKCGDTITDIDGNVYKTVNIGNQCWMQENLKTRHYNEGTVIQTDLDSSQWRQATNGAYCYPDNDSNNNAVYGKLYNWWTVYSGKIAPKGWHVPSKYDWATLFDFVGNFTANKMRTETGWTQYTGITNTNSSGFSALPAGGRDNKGLYSSPVGEVCGFWSSSVPDYSSESASCCTMYYTSFPAYFNTFYVSYGFSIRCVKD